MPGKETAKAKTPVGNQQGLEVPAPIIDHEDGVRMPPPFNLTAGPARKEEVYDLQQAEATPEKEPEGKAQYDGFFEGILHSRFVEILENTYPGSRAGLQEYFESLVKQAGEEPDWASINDALIDKILDQLTMVNLDFDKPGEALKDSRKKAQTRQEEEEAEMESDDEFDLSSGPPSFNPQISVINPEGEEEEADPLYTGMSPQFSGGRRRGFSQQISLPAGGLEPGGLMFGGRSASLLPRHLQSEPDSRRNSLAIGQRPRHSSTDPNLSAAERRNSSVPRRESKRRDDLQTGFTRQYIDAVDKVARLRQEVIMVRDPNEKSAVFHQAGFSTKPLNMKGKTDRLTGLIPRRQELSKAKEGGPTTLAKCQQSIDDGLAKGIYTALTVREIIQEASPQARKLLRSTPLGELEKTDPGREYICNPKRKPITADYDLLGIGRRKVDAETDADTTADQPLSIKDVGFSTPSAIGTIIDLNVQVKADGYDGGLLFHHGAEDRNEKFTQAQGKSVLFDPTKEGPETISSLDGNMQYFDRKLKELDRKGFDVYRNENWKQPEEHRSMTKVMQDYNSLGGRHGLKEMSISDFHALNPQKVYQDVMGLPLDKAEDIQQRERIIYYLKQLDPTLELQRATTPHSRGPSRSASPIGQHPKVPAKQSQRKADIRSRIAAATNELAEKYPTIEAIEVTQLDGGVLGEIGRKMKGLTGAGSQTPHEDFLKARRVIQLIKDLNNLG